MTGMVSKRLMAMGRGSGSAQISHTYFVRNGNVWNVTDKKNVDLHTTLPAGNYTIQVHPMTGAMFLQESESFDLPTKLYGDCVKNADRILHTFEDRSGSTGVLLSGEKGSGKTLLAKKLSIEGAKRGYPTIIINSPLHGESFNQFIASISQPCIVLFDEFEKVYEDNQQQDALLTLLDGTVSGHKLFILTCNQTYRINVHMLNRPSRLYYNIEYKGLDQGFIKEYCEDNLTDKTNTPSVLQISNVFSAFNFDMLKSIVEEMNRYNETAQEVMRLLNTRPELGAQLTYSIEAFVDSKAVPCSDNQMNFNPFMQTDAINIYWEENPEDPKHMEGHYISLQPHNITLVSKDGSSIVYVVPFAGDKNVMLVLTRIQPPVFDFFKAL